MTDYDDLVASLLERGTVARQEGTGTALGDALHFEKAAGAITALQARVAEEEGWVDMLRDERDELLRQRNVALTRAEAAEARVADLIPRADAELAVAEAIRRAADMIEDNVRHAKELGREIWAMPDLRALAPADALAALSRLAVAEAENTRLKRQVETLKTGWEIADRDRIKAEAGEDALAKAGSEARIALAGMVRPDNAVNLLDAALAAYEARRKG